MWPIQVQMIIDRHRYLDSGADLRLVTERPDPHNRFRRRRRIPRWLLPETWPVTAHLV
jgi:hypothetical protein